MISPTLIERAARAIAMEMQRQLVEARGAVHGEELDTTALASAALTAAGLDKMEEALRLPRLQLEYLDERFPPASTPPTTARIDAALKGYLAMSDELKPIEVTQADREAAAGFDAARLGYPTPYQQEIREGQHDEHTVVQHFAAYRHRLAHCPPLAERLSPDGEAVAALEWTGSHGLSAGGSHKGVHVPSLIGYRIHDHVAGRKRYKIYRIGVNKAVGSASTLNGAKAWAQNHFAKCINAALTTAQAEARPFQDRVQPWMMACFGAEISADRIERNHRFLEEALELVQSLGCTASEAHQLVDYTFSRAAGEPMQEVGGVMVTLAALCLAADMDMHRCGEAELARISAPATIEKIRAKQVAKPKHSSLPAAEARRDVPREPTEAMIKAGRRAVPDTATVEEMMGGIWRAMYDASPPSLEALDERREGADDLERKAQELAEGWVRDRGDVIYQGIVRSMARFMLGLPRLSALPLPGEKEEDRHDR